MSDAIKQSAADALFDEMVGSVDLWHDPQRRAYAAIKSESLFRNRRLDSKDFASHLSGASHKRFRRCLKSAARDEVLQRLEGVAIHEGPAFEVFSRIGWSGGNAYLALHDDRGSVVEIGPDGWRLVDPEPLDIRFVAGKTTLPLPEPVRGGSVEDLGRFLHVSPGDLRLVAAFLVGCFLPHGTLPILSVSGEQGSGKSFASRIVKGVLDPARASKRPFPKDQGSLMAAVESSCILLYDNLGSLSAENSDDLCRIASGSGLAKRRLYSDADEHVTEARRSVILNGIAYVVPRSDLADRSLSIQLLPFAPGSRRPEEELEAEFAAALPAILGALLDRVSRGLAQRSRVEAPDVRLADFARLAIASCADDEEAAVLSQDLLENAERVKRAVIDEDDLAMGLLKLTESQEFYGTADQLLTELSRLPGLSLPKSASGLSHRLTRLIPALRGVGVVVVKHPKTRVGIVYTIRREDEQGRRVIVRDGRELCRNEDGILVPVPPSQPDRT